MLARFLTRRRGLLILLAALLPLLFWWRSRGPSGDAGSLEASLAEALGTEGFRVDASTIQWLEDDAGLLAGRPALFAAIPPGEELPDIHYAEVRPGSGGSVVGVANVTNVTRTAGASETILHRTPDHLLYASRVGGEYDAFVVVDLRGEPESLTSDWSAFGRFQNSITNAQQTGRTAGFGRQRYALLPPVPTLSATGTGDHVTIRAGEARIVVDPDRVEPVEGADRVEVRPASKGRPDTIPWVVDTVRFVVGPEPIEWLEHHVFAAQDWAERTWFGAVGTDGQDTTDAVAEELGMTAEEQQRRLRLTAPDPETGWPPPPLAPILDSAVEGEGQWIPLVDDPFINRYPNAPPAFYQTFVRADPERLYTRIYVILFDPRQVQLHTMPGTLEPRSATGETGPGRVAHDERSLDLLVGGFNGGFQALHGEFGMMHGRRSYLPPKPWAATVTITQDGRLGFGSWPGPPPRRAWSESVANAQIPDDVVALRQNLTSLVEDGVYNPWRRWYWGAAPAGGQDQTYIDRTGMCLTREGFVAYFWGESLGPEEIGRAMIATRCVRAMHLDMNTRHAGFVFFDTKRPGEPWATIDRPLDDEWEHEGPLEDAPAPGWMYRSRKAVRAMALSPFPRYVPSDPRDFFYLTLRPVLPGAEIGGQALSTEGLPHAGWPHAFARVRLGNAWVVRIDPARAVPAPMMPVDPTPGAQRQRPLGFFTGARGLAVPGAPHALYVEPGVEHVGWRYAVGAPSPEARVILAAPALAGGARAALGVDRHGFLVYAEGEGPLADTMRQAGVENALGLPDGVRLAFAVEGGPVAPDGVSDRPVIEAQAVALVAETRAAAEVIFRDVTPMPYARWGRLQDTRVRYLRDPGHVARFGTPPSADGTSPQAQPDAGPP